MAETLTGSQRLRAYIVGLNGKITAMETENRTLGQSVEGGNTRIAALETELAGFQGLADEYAPAAAEAEPKAPAKG